MDSLTLTFLGTTCTLAVTTLGAFAWVVRMGAQVSANREADQDIKRRVRRLENRAMGLPANITEGADYGN